MKERNDPEVLYRFQFARRYFSVQFVFIEGKVFQFKKGQGGGGAFALFFRMIVAFYDLV